MFETRPPHPTEETLTHIIVREWRFPDGRTAQIRMSEWHWQLVAYYDQWAKDMNWEQGILYDWFKKKEYESDRFFSDLAMLSLGDWYRTQKVARKTWI